MKRIIHFKVPTDRDGKPVMNREMSDKYVESIQNKLGDSYICISSPFDVEIVNKNAESRINKVLTPSSKFEEDFRRRTSSLSDCGVE